LLALAGKALTRVRQDRARAEIASLTGLDKTAAAFKAQLSSDDVVDEKANISKIVKRSLPSQNPVWQPEPSVDVRLREARQYYEVVIGEAETELERAQKAGFIPQEIPARLRRLKIERDTALDKIRGRDIRK